MMKKMMLVAVAVLAAGLVWGSLAPKTEAEAMLAGPYAPDGIRIPATIELLADTPYYSDPEQPDNKPEGIFAPRTVKVLRTQAAWSIGAATWQIETMFGPRWIRPKPWEIDIVPPGQITLLEETALYSSQSERGGPVVSLSPQEVQVTGAEKQWFYTNQPSSKAWIQVHTTWLGDLWAHIPVNRIGTVQKVEHKAHFYGLSSGSTLASAMGITVEKHDEQSQHVSSKGDFTIVGEFTTIYDRVFQVQIDNGTTWSGDKGIELLDTNETLELTGEKPLISDIWDGPFKELGLLQGEKVTAFEKVAEPLWGGGTYRGIPPVWSGGTWYHVRTSKGTGWVNKLYGEPESAIPVHWKVDLAEQRELHRYPSIPFTTSTLLLRNQTVEAMAVWDDPSGLKWLRVTVDGRTGWIPLWSSYQDRIWDENAGTALQISVSDVNGVGIVSSTDGELRLYNDQKIGYVENGKDYLEAALLVEQLRFRVEMVPNADAVIFSQGDYSFQLEAGYSIALIYWHGSLQRSVGLQEHPRRTGVGWHLNVHDLRKLFGLTQEISHGQYYYLFEKNYNVELGTPPTRVKNGRLEIQAFLYSWTNQQELKGVQIPVQMSLEENGDRGGDSLVIHNEAVVSGSDIGKDAPASLFNVTASRPLTPGLHQVDVVLRVGERIVWKQTIRVTAEL